MDLSYYRMGTFGSEASIKISKHVFIAVVAGAGISGLVGRVLPAAQLDVLEGHLAVLGRKSSKDEKLYGVVTTPRLGRGRESLRVLVSLATKSSYVRADCECCRSWHPTQRSMYSSGLRSWAKLITSHVVNYVRMELYEVMQILSSNNSWMTSRVLQCIMITWISSRP